MAPTASSLAAKLVIMSIKTISSDGSAAAQLLDQLLAGGTREEGHDDIGVGDVGKLGALFGETPDVVLEGLARLLFVASEVP
jgi:hypothetical protein